jgi:hypothetical protein
LRPACACSVNRQCGLRLNPVRPLQPLHLLFTSAHVSNERDQPNPVMAHALQTAEELRQHVQAIRIGAAGTAKTTRKLRTTGFSQDINASACAKIRIRMSSFMLSGTSNGNHSNIVCDKASEETFKVLWGLQLAGQVRVYIEMPCISLAPAKNM